MNFKQQQLFVLKEKNQDYQPEQQQIIAYASQVLDLKFPQDEKFLYLAKQALLAPLPDQWQACSTLDDQILFRNKISGHLQQDHPLDQIYRWKIIQLKNAQLKSKQLQSESLDKIDEQSMINQSSQYMKNSSQKRNEKDLYSQNLNNISDMDNITEQSHSQSFPNIKQQQKSDLSSLNQPFNLQQFHRQKINQIKTKLLNYIPDPNKIITEAIKNPEKIKKNNFNERQIKKIQQLIKIKEKIENKKNQLFQKRKIKQAKMQKLFYLKSKFDNRII